MPTPPIAFDRIAGPTPRVSIGLPVYNGQKFLADSLAALLNQTYADFELIIADNASTDDTQSICRAFAARDRRIRYVRNSRNAGAARNYRLAFDLSRGAYFCWAAHDDVLAPTYLARCVEVLDRQPDVVLAYAKTMLIDESGRHLQPYNDGLHLMSDSPRERLRQLLANIGMCNAIYGLHRSAVLRKVRPMGAYIASDNPFLAEICLFGKFLEIDAHLFFRRLHQDAYSAQKDGLTLARFYNPSRKRASSLVECRHLIENFRSALRAPLPFGEKLAICADLARHGIQIRSHIASELYRELSCVASLRSSTTRL